MRNKYNYFLSFAQATGKTVSIRNQALKEFENGKKVAIIAAFPQILKSYLGDKAKIISTKQTKFDKIHLWRFDKVLDIIDNHIEFDNNELLNWRNNDIFKEYDYVYVDSDCYESIINDLQGDVNIQAKHIKNSTSEREEQDNKEKQQDEIIEKHCKILGKIVEKIGNLKYNGAMVCLSEQNYIPESTWELRFDKNYNCDEGTIIFRALDQAIEEDEIFKENDVHGYFLSKYCDEPIGHGWQMAYLVIKDKIQYLISIILRWDCRNWYIMEYEILPFKEPFGEYGMQYWFDLLCKKNWSKLHLPFHKITYGNDVISYLPTNKVVDVPEIVKQHIKEQKEDINGR